MCCIKAKINKLIERILHTEYFLRTDTNKNDISLLKISKGFRLSKVNQSERNTLK